MHSVLSVGSGSGSPPPSQRDALEMSGLATGVCWFAVLFLRAGGQVGLGTVTGFFTVSDQVVFAAGRSCKKQRRILTRRLNYSFLYI